MAANNTWTAEEMLGAEALLDLFDGGYHQREQAAHTLWRLLLAGGGNSQAEQVDVVGKGSRSPSLHTVASSGSTESIESEASSSTTPEATANEDTGTRETSDRSNGVDYGGGKGKGKEKNASSNGDNEDTRRLQQR